MSTLLVVSACNEKPEGGAPAGAQSAQPLTTSSADIPTPGASTVQGTSSVVGVAPSGAPSAPIAEGPAVDPALMKRMRQTADACPWNHLGTKPKADCKALAEWRSYLFEPANDHQADLMSLLADRDQRIVFLAAIGLEVDGITGTDDPKLAAMVFDALEQQKDADICTGIALQASHIPLGRLGLQERAKKFLKEHPACRGPFAAHVLFKNPDLYEAVAELAKSDPNSRVRADAAIGLREGVRGIPEHQKRNCVLWGELLDDSGEDYEATAAWLIGTQGSRALTEPCTEQWPLLLTKAEALATAGKLQKANWEQGVCGLLDERRVDEQTKVKATAVLRKIVEGTGNLDFARADALNCLRRFDADAKTFAKSFESDPSEKVQTAAKRILETTP